MKSRDKQKPLYLHYHSVYSHQKWQGGDLHWGTSTHKVTQPIKDIVIYRDGMPLIKLHDPFITWLYEITWQVKYITFQLKEDLQAPSYKRQWLCSRDQDDVMRKIEKRYIFNFIKLMTTKLCRMVTSGRRFRTSTCTIMFIIFWDFLMVAQIFLWPQVKRSVIISSKLVDTSCLTSCQLT